MRKSIELLLCIILFAAFLGISGCTAPGETVSLGQTEIERNARLKRIEHIRHRQFVEDIDTMFLADQPSKLSEWHIR